MVWFMQNMFMLLSLGNHRRIRVFGYIALFSFLLKKANFEPTFDIHEPTTFAITLRMLIEQAKHRILHASGDVVPKLRQMWNHEKFQLTEFHSRPRYLSVRSRLVDETKELMSCILHQITNTIPQRGLLSPQCQWGIRALGFTMQYYPEGYFLEFEKKVIQLSNENVLTKLTDLQLRLIIIGLFLVRALIMEILLEPQHLGFEAKPLMTEEENFRILASIFVYVYRIIVHDSELRMTRKFGLKFRPVKMKGTLAQKLIPDNQVRKITKRLGQLTIESYMRRLQSWASDYGKQIAKSHKMAVHYPLTQYKDMEQRWSWSFSGKNV
ncbi:hypothetical protein CRM22_008203 [Opisthorchis felineus]|uniref:Uncharacterized protein n=1 Tax=Opisthorchis felineus TaxID=147828 RepID=A0A4S2LCQ2_OPIFE|nr:hypothetical protein CRM22_008203 [Opisthorchis felineus]